MQNHSYGKQTQTKSSRQETEGSKRWNQSTSDKFTSEKERCIFENDDTIVEHLIMTFPDDTKEAVMGVWTKKDGKLICFENEGTPIK
jgi:hypothetical protein